MRLSGILFGPPGTAKTTLAEGLAEILGWPLISLGPYNFLQNGSEGVAVAAARVFKWLHALEDCVVLFDEMEEFMRSRVAASLDREQNLVPNAMTTDELDRVFTESSRESSVVTNTDYIQRLWTTLFLPLLQELRDGARVIFLVATNHFESVDPAIVRPGRFDFRVHVMPPTPARNLREIFVPALKKQLQLTDDDWEELERWLTDLTSEQRWILKEGSSYSDTGTPPQSSHPGNAVITDIEMPYGFLLSEYFSVGTRFRYFTMGDCRAWARSLLRKFENIPAGNVMSTTAETVKTRALESFCEVVPSYFEYDPRNTTLGCSRLRRPEPKEFEELPHS